MVAKKADNGLDPKAREILDMLTAVEPMNNGTPEQARSMEKLGNPFELGPRNLAYVKDIHIPGPGGDLPIRIYVPQTDHPGTLPALVFYHGGGFVIGSIKTHDTITQNLAAEANCIVISVGYRLSPEAKFPAAVEDALAAFRWVSDNADKVGINPDRVAVGGDSAGGNLAAVTAIRCRDEGGAQPVFQLLVYPVTDFSRDTPSKKDFAQGYYLTTELMEWFHGHYLQNKNHAGNPHVSPLLAADHKGLPPTLVITCGFDMLRDEGKAYADKLSDAGVDVIHSCYTNMIHGFISFGGVLQQGRAAVRQCAAALMEAFV